MKNEELTIEEVQFVAHTLARQWMSWDEPIPDFSTRFPNSLESCIGQPFQVAYKKKLYPSTKKRGAILFYLMIKNHPFKNGNKRIAITTLLYFLHKQKKWLKIDNQELYNFAKFVAESSALYKEKILEIIEQFIEHYIVDSDEKN